MTGTEASPKKQFLYTSVKEDLLKNIQSFVYAEGQLIPSEKELSHHYNVSLITVRRALDELVKEGWVEKIKGKGSVVSSRGLDRQPLRENLGQIGILMLAFKRPVYSFELDYINNWSSKIIYGMKKVLGNETEILIDGMPYEALGDRLAYSPINNVEKLLLIGNWDEQAIDYLQKNGKQVFLYNNFNPAIDVPSVNNNEKEACYEAISYLISRNHKRIAVINGYYDYSESKERYLGYLNAMLDHGMDVLPFYTKWGDYSPESGYLLMQELLEAPSRPTVVFCSNDTVAAGAYHAIKDANLSCPEDISIFSHDNLDFSAELAGGLSTIDPRFEEVGVELGKMLMQSTDAPATSVVSCEMILRHSVKDLRE